MSGEPVATVGKRQTHDINLAMVIGGTFAIHTIFIVAMDVMMVTNPHLPPEIAPKIGLVDVKIVAKPKPPPPPQARTEPPVKSAHTKPQTRTIREPQVRPPPTPQLPPVTDETAGGAPTIAMPDVAPSATGVAVRVGKRNTGPVGQGGKGTGTGSGEGSGALEIPPPTPVSVATIKTRAMPKGDYGYIDAGKDYPAAARQLGIEGPIKVRLVVDDKGKVKSAVLLNKLGHGLDELALDRSKKIEFEPAKDTDDKPVSSVVIWTFNMTLPK